MPIKSQLSTNFSKSSFKNDFSIVLSVRQLFKPLDRRETSALLNLRYHKLKILSDTNYALSLPFNNSATLKKYIYKGNVVKLKQVSVNV